MSTRAEKERLKHLQEKFQATLANLLKDDDNKYCVDCDAKGALIVLIVKNNLYIGNPSSLTVIIIILFYSGKSSTYI